MSAGLLLVRLRAYRREEAWAPPYVADKLDGTTREAVRLRQDATVLGESAGQAAGEDRDTVSVKSAEARALADQLDQRIRDLAEADAVRTRWYLHTAETRAAADRARVELVDRGIDPDQPADEVTTQEWLAARGPVPSRYCNASPATALLPPDSTAIAATPHRPPSATTPSAPSATNPITSPEAKIMKFCDDPLRPPSHFSTNLQLRF